MPRLLLVGATTLLMLLLQPFLATGFTSCMPPCLTKERLGSVPHVPQYEYEHGSFATTTIRVSKKTTRTTTTTTSLQALLDVDDNFFSILLPTLSLFLAFSKAVARSRLEERAWELRCEESRLAQLERDPTVTEIDLRKKEAAAEWSAYGNSNNEKEERNSGGGKQRRVTTRQREEDATNENTDETREFSMSPQEIQDFEQEFGVAYDPYYDDPYTEEELPEDVPYKVDKLYGDRIYKDGEVFYKDDKSGLYYRQGAQPKSQKFW